MHTLVRLQMRDADGKPEDVALVEMPVGGEAEVLLDRTAEGSVIVDSATAKPDTDLVNIVERLNRGLEGLHMALSEVTARAQWVTSALFDLKKRIDP